MICIYEVELMPERAGCIRPINLVVRLLHGNYKLIYYGLECDLIKKDILLGTLLANFVPPAPLDYYLFSI